ncbi:MAG: hypothetical protein HY075_02100 [Deltaproteobacteria bacterium]|nr:hypothetical protein [Deltaproteobacteria bacterium]
MIRAGILFLVVACILLTPSATSREDEGGKSRAFAFPRLIGAVPARVRVRLKVLRSRRVGTAQTYVVSGGGRLDERLVRAGYDLRACGEKIVCGHAIADSAANRTQEAAVLLGLSYRF